MCPSSAPTGPTSSEFKASREELIKLIDEHTRFRTGIGYDVHRFKKGRPLILAGLSIPHTQGLDGHSDADVIAHAAMDAVLGACGSTDIGSHFPNDDPKFKDANSLLLAQEVVAIIKKLGFELRGLDLMVVAEEPKLKPFIIEMRKNLAKAFAIKLELVGLKATTNESMGWIGRGEGIACLASALVRSLPTKS